MWRPIVKRNDASLKSGLMKNLTSLFCILAMFSAIVSFGGCVTLSRKAEFMNKMSTLELSGGDMFSKDSVTKVVPDLPILLSIDVDDLVKISGLDHKDIDVSMLGVLSGQLGEIPKCQDYVMQHFDNIRNPELKVLWGALLVMHNRQTPEIIDYLRHAMKTSRNLFLLETGWRTEELIKLRTLLGVSTGTTTNVLEALPRL